MSYPVESKRRLAAEISQRLRKAVEVRPFPAAVARLASACHDPKTNSKKLATIIECDPALSAKLLRLANSPMYCPASEVKSIAHSVSLIGLRRLRAFAMSVAGAAMFLTVGRARQQRLKLWNHSVGCAVVARSLADYVPGVDRDEVFLGGVFHDVGKLLFYDTIPAEYAEVDDAYSGLELVEEECLRFGTTHEEVGLTTARSWGLPNEIKAAIGGTTVPYKLRFVPPLLTSSMPPIYWQNTGALVLAWCLKLNVSKALPRSLG